MTRIPSSDQPLLATSHRALVHWYSLNLLTVSVQVYSHNIISCVHKSNLHIELDTSLVSVESTEILTSPAENTLAMIISEVKSLRPQTHVNIYFYRHKTWDGLDNITTQLVVKENA